MSQERSELPVAAASVFLALLAYATGLVAMAFTQGLLATRLELRFVLLFSEVALALPALIAAFLLASRLPEIHRFRPLAPNAALMTVALGLAFWALSLGVFEAQYVFVKPPLAYLRQFQGLHDSLRPGSLMGWFLSLAAIAAAPAICEETVFRGLLTPVFRKAAGPAFAIVVSAALFGAIHVDGLADGTRVYYRVPFAFVLGLLLARLRIETGSLWPPIIAHATLNATTFCAVVFIAEEPANALPDSQPLVALGMLLMGAAAVRTLMRRTRPAAQTSS